VSYRSDQSFPPEKFRQEIALYFQNLQPEVTSSGKVYFTGGCWCARAARSRILYKQTRHACASNGQPGKRTIYRLKETRVAAIAFLQYGISRLIIKSQQKTKAEHGTTMSEEAQTLLYKTRKII
jgi:hypothetical protein